MLAASSSITDSTQSAIRTTSAPRPTDGSSSARGRTRSSRWTAPAGCTRCGRATTVPDSCHVNCITAAEGDLWATAFGWFDSFKGWRGTRAVGAGVLWNLRTGEEITGFSHPHTPRRVGDEWFVCESLNESFVRRDRAGTELQRVELGGYTRGVAFVDDRVLVGVERAS